MMHISWRQRIAIAAIVMGVWFWSAYGLIAGIKQQITAIVADAAASAASEAAAKFQDRIGIQPTADTSSDLATTEAPQSTKELKSDLQQ